MKKLITAAALTAFALATTTAMAEDTKQNAATQKTPTQQQMETQSTSGAKVKAGTTGAGMQTNIQGQSSSKLPGKPTDNTKDTSK